MLAWLLSSSPALAALGLALVAVAGLAARVITDTKTATSERVCRAVDAADRALAGPAAPFIIAVCSAAVVWFVWGSLRQVGVNHDELAYVLQAQIFAAGRWVAPSPPLPEFFQQFHVLDLGWVAAKYPPGHSLTIAPGMWFDLPGLMPVLLSGAAGALVFALPRRLINPWVGLLAWWLWITDKANVFWRASYFSEVTTSVVWLVAWWLLIEWRTSRRWSPLLALAAVVGWGAITRPLTALVLAVPIAVIVVRDVARDRRWAQLAGALAVGGSILTLIPVWSANTTGDWRVTPLALYTRTYIPWDHPGLGLDTTPPRIHLRPDLMVEDSIYEILNREHTVRALPGILVDRVRAIGTDTDHDWRKAVPILVVVGLVVAPAEGFFVALTAGLLVVAYLCYVQMPHWTIYYLELIPVLAWLAAFGCWRGLIALAPGTVASGADHPPAAPRAAIAVALILLATLPFTASDTLGAGRYTRSHAGYQRSFSQKTAALPVSKAVIFVRYGPRHGSQVEHYRSTLGMSLVGNTPDPATARVWVAYDRGDTNAALMRSAPDRVPYLFDDARDTLLRVEGPGLTQRR